MPVEKKKKRNINLVNKFLFELLKVKMSSKQIYSKKKNVLLAPEIAAADPEKGVVKEC